VRPSFIYFFNMSTVTLKIWSVGAKRRFYANMIPQRTRRTSPYKMYGKYLPVIMDPKSVKNLRFAPTQNVFNVTVDI